MCEGGFDSICQEAYGPGGVALVMSCDPAAPPDAEALRRLLRRHGARPGAAGSVAYLFRDVGWLRYAATEGLAALAISAGAEDVLHAGEELEVLTDPVEQEAVRRRLARRGHVPGTSGRGWRAAHAVQLAADDRARLDELVQELRGLQGVRQVYTNAQTADEFLAQV